ncbi:MAG: methyl-accepting chemotaxis protein [Spirochaetaceae bacterium]|jgi:methyl-accepting chemotaxis protein|nr:methyl-accepting chemotaxis protein [Spirochaetaceae bacterium]
MKIREKLIALIIALNLLGTGILVGSLLSLSRSEINGLLEREISNLGAQHGKDIQIWLEIYMDAARTAAQIMEEYRDIPQELRRSVFSLINKTLVDKNPEVIGSASIWEPNALDGLDDQYANAPESDGTGRFIPWWYRGANGIAVEPLRGYDTPGIGDFYLDAKRTGKENIIEPYFYPLEGEDVLMTTLSAPVKENGRFLGAVTIDISIEAIQKQAKKIQPYPGTVAMVYSNKGFITAHFDESRFSKHLLEADQDTAGPYLQQLSDAVQNGRPFRFVHRVKTLEKTMLFTCIPFAVGQSTTPWALVIGIPQDVILAPIRRMAIIGILLGLFTIALTGTGAFFIARSIANPLKRLVSAFKDIGEGDLTRELPISNRDEIGEMTLSLQGTLAQIRGLIREIRDRADSLSGISAELQQNMDKTGGAVAAIVCSVENVKTKAEGQSGSLQETASAVQRITENIGELNGHIERQSAGVTQSSEAVQAMIGNIRQVTAALTESAGSIRTLLDASGAGHTGLEEVAGDIREIAEESEGLLAINGVMQNIAAQTNLLSMNAAIEAAHAGSAGKGFAVVADEIRKLAENSSRQSKSIAAVLKKIKESIDKISRSTRNALERFEAIDGGVKLVSSQTAAIQTAMEAQRDGSRQILSAMESLTEITSLVKNGSAEMLRGSREVMAEERNLEQATAGISAGLADMSDNAQRIGSAVNEVNRISGVNKENIDVLVREVSRFKVG